METDASDAAQVAESLQGSSPGNKPGKQELQIIKQDLAPEYRLL